MKLLFSLLILLSSNAAWAQYSEVDQKVIEIAKEIRRSLWVSGHEDVTSQSMPISKMALDYHVKKENNEKYVESLSREEISSLYRCYYSDVCTLYVIYASGSMWGDSGSSSHFVLISEETLEYRMIEHITYSE